MKKQLLVLLLIILSAKSFGQIPSYVPTSGLVGWWSFTGNANDSSGLGNNGIVYGPTLTIDRFGNANCAYNFNGTSDFIKVPDSNSLDISNHFTFSVWVKLIDYSFNADPGWLQRTMLGKGRDTLGGGYALRAIDIFPQPYAYNCGINTPLYNGGPGSPDSLSLGVWSNVVATYDGGTAKLYKNGILVATEVLTASLTNSTQPLFFGREFNSALSTARMFKGALDDIGIWNQALTPCEIYHLYHASSAPVTAGTITGTSTVCVSNTITLSNTVSSGIWSTSNSHASVTGGVVTGLSGGIDTISYTVTNICGSAVVTKIITVFPSLTTSIITTFAGTGASGYSGDGGPSTAASIYGPSEIAVDLAGNLYISDNGNSRIRKVSPSGIISTIAGNGINGYGGDGGPATLAAINGPSAVTIDVTGNIYIADPINRRIRKVTPTGIISTVAGNGINGYSGDGGAATSAQISNAYGIAVDPSGNIFIADASNRRIRKVNTAGIISTVAGNGGSGYSGDGGSATTAQISNPFGVAIDAIGNIYISDASNHRIRKVNTAGIISTIAGNGTNGYSGDGGIATAAQISIPYQVVCDLIGNVYIADNDNMCIRKINTAGIISTFAGNGIYGFSGDGGLPTLAQLSGTPGLAVDAVGNVYISDYNNNRIRKVTITNNIAPITGSTTVCVGSTTILIDTTTGGTWSSSNSSIATVGSAGVVTGVLAGTASISYTITNTCGTATTSKIISVNPLPIAGTITGSSSVCAGSAIILSNTVTGGTWSSSNTAIAIIGTTGIVTGVTAGIDTIKYTVTNTCGTIAATQIFTVSSLPILGTISGSSTLCIGSSTTLTNGISGGTWSVTNGNAIVTSGGVVYGLISGIDTVIYTVTNSCGTSSTTKFITINALPNTGIISGSSGLCAGSTTTLSNTVIGGSWLSSNTAVATIGSTGIVSGIIAGTATISYTLTNSCGTATAIKNITVNPMPNAGTIIGGSMVCVGSNIALSDPSTGGTWSATNARASVSGGIVTGIIAGVDTISYTVTNGCGTATVNKVITINALPNAGTIIGLPSACAGSTISLTDVAIGGSWSSSTTLIATIGTTGIVTGVSAGTAIISYSVTNTCGTAVATLYIAINPLPNAGSITGLSSVCTGSNITLTDASTGGLWSATNSNAIVSSGGIVYGMVAGIDTIKYIVTNSCGTASASKTITINPLPNAGIILGLSAVCPAASITLTDASVGGTWSASNGNATILAGIVTGITAGIDTISYTVTNICGTAITSRTITINPLPVSGTIMGLSSVCSGSNITLTNSVIGGLWTATNSNAIVSTGGVVYGMATGIDTIIYSVTNSCGTVTAIKVVTVNSLPNAGTISGPSGVCIGATETLSDPITGGTWSASNGNATVSIVGVVTGVTVGIDTIIYSFTNSCGTATTTKIITINILPVAGTITGMDTVCISQTITLTDTTTGGVWSVITGAATVSSTGVVIGINYGVDTVLYTVTNTCGAAIAKMPIMVLKTGECQSGVNNVLAPSQNMTLYPNPTQNNITITASEIISSVVISNLLGQNVFSAVYNDREVVISLDQLTSGIYVVKINDTTVYKVVKQ